MEILLEHMSVSCNRTPHCVDWNASGLLAYGADKSIALAAERCVRRFLHSRFSSLSLHTSNSCTIQHLTHLILQFHSLHKVLGSFCAHDTVPGTITPPSTHPPTHTHIHPPRVVVAWDQFLRPFMGTRRR